MAAELSKLLPLLVLSCSCSDEPADPPAGQQETPAGEKVEIPRQEPWDGGPGRWRRARDGELTPEQLELFEELAAVGYAAGVNPAGDLFGITRHDPRALEGTNLYTSGHAPEALLIDMEGNVLHRWSHDFETAFPEKRADSSVAVTAFWRRTTVLPNGDLYAIFEGLGLIKLDKDSNLLWKSPISAHHELALLPGGGLLVLSRESRILPRINPGVPLLEDFVTELSADGEVVRRVSVLECLERSGHFSRFRKRIKLGMDAFHTNTLKLLDDTLADRMPAFAPGNVLISILKLNAIAVLNLDQETCDWLRTGQFLRQHDPRVLSNGNLLLFDNNMREVGSSVLEIDLVNQEVAWAYRGTDSEPFFSNTCGTAQRLSNGNTLITESDNGRAFEVTREGEIVWEFMSPHRAGPSGEYVASLFELVRLPADFGAEWRAGAK